MRSIEGRFGLKCPEKSSQAMSKHKKGVVIAKITINTGAVCECRLKAAELAELKDNCKHSVNADMLTETWINYNMKTDNEVKKEHVVCM